MKTSRVVSLKNLGFLNYIVKNRVIIILCITFVLGITAGVFSYSGSNTAQRLAENTFSFFISNRQGRSFFAVLFTSFLTNAAVLIVCYLCGTSLMGVIAVPLFIALCGFWYGNFSAFLYSGYALKGIAFNAVVLLPPVLIFFICLTFSARESIGFSLLLAKTTLPKSRPINLCIDFKNYCGRYLLLSIIAIVSALADALLTKTLLRFFQF